MNTIEELTRSAAEGDHAAARHLDRRGAFPIDAALAACEEWDRPLTVVTRPFLQRAEDAVAYDRNRWRMKDTRWADTEWLITVVLQMTMFDGRGDVGRVDYNNGQTEFFEGPCNQLNEHVEASQPLGNAGDTDEWAKLFKATRGWTTDLMTQGCIHRGDKPYGFFQDISTGAAGLGGVRPWVCGCGRIAVARIVQQGHTDDTFARGMVTAGWRVMLPLEEAA